MCECTVGRSITDWGSEAAIHYCALHAAAPELLDVLEACVYMLEGEWSDARVVQEARQLISEVRNDS